MRYVEILECLTDRHVRFVVAGGVAVVLHGVPRTTFDLDLLLDMEPGNVHVFLSTMLDLGLRPGAPIDPTELADPEKRELWIREKNLIALSFADPRGGAVDVLLATPITYSVAIRDADTIRLGERSFGIASIPTLIRMKEAAGRDQDRADIAALRQILDMPAHAEDDE